MNSGENNSKKIAIFVSHRIDLKSMVVDNPLYVPVRCGAALDENDKGNAIMGDNTGDNISEKRISFCEYTVQYWAWKNYDADYYGLCHYRRYLSFMDSFMPGNDYDVRMENNLSVRTAELYQLFNKSKMEKEISSYDVIVGKAFDTTKITRVRPRNSVKELWYASRNLVDPIAIDTLIKIIEDRHPELVESMNEYFASKYYRGYNCFVMSKKIFNEYNKVLLTYSLSLINSLTPPAMRATSSEPQAIWARSYTAFICGIFSITPTASSLSVRLYTSRIPKQIPMQIPLHSVLCHTRNQTMTSRFSFRTEWILTAP